MVDFRADRQGGAALVVALVVLLVMSVIGVTSVSNSTVQQRMAFNLRQQQLAENAAEHALREAERYIADAIVSPDALDDFYGDDRLGSSFYMAISVDGKPYSEQAAQGVSEITFWTANGIEVPGLSTEATSRPPRYILEMIGKTDEGRPRSVRNLTAGAVSNFRYNFRVTAIGWGVDPNAYAILQSAYETVRITAE